MDIILATVFGVKADCINQQKNEFTYWGKRMTEKQPLWKALLVFSSKIMNYFSIPVTNKNTSKFFMQLFCKNVEYRRTNNITVNDFMSLLIELMEEGYVKCNDEEDVIGASSKYLNLVIIF